MDYWLNRTPLMKNDFIIRDYKNTDKDSVLNLIRLNTPNYFSVNEEKDLDFYLENEIDYYYVIEINQQIVGSGGINFKNNKSIGVISWDMIDPDFQGKTFGSALLNYRIEKLKQCPEVQQIIVRTSQLANQFYEKNGFSLIEIVEDYWDKGYHLYSMKYTKSIV